MRFASCSEPVRAPFPFPADAYGAASSRASFARSSSQGPELFSHHHSQLWTYSGPKRFALVAPAEERPVVDPVTTGARAGVQVSPWAESVLR